MREAAHMLSLDVKTLNQAFDRATLRPPRSRRRRPGNAPRTVCVPDLLAFAIEARTSTFVSFTRIGRATLRAELQGTRVRRALQAVEDELASLQDATGRLDRTTTRLQELTARLQDLLAALDIPIGPVRISVGDLLAPVLAGMTEVAASRGAVVRDPEIRGGEPVVVGTRIPVSMLADLKAQGVEDAVLLADHPQLTPDLLAQALLYARLHPRVGRPKHGEAPWRATAPQFVVEAGTKQPTAKVRTVAVAASERDRRVTGSAR
jgi:uncharacterized protein (DUF433 family)